MKVDRLDIVDWEPCVSIFDFGNEAAPVDTLRPFIDAWLRDRQRAGVCSCPYRYLEYSKRDCQAALTLETEWACDVCMQALAGNVKDKFDALREVRLGLRGTVAVPDESPFIQVEGREVEFEDGRHELVEPFLIARHPASVGEFETFVADTGFATLAEQEEDGQTFRHNCALSGLAKSQRLSVAAMYVTPIEAEAYCRHVGCRLPTEAE